MPFKKIICLIAQLRSILHTGNDEAQIAKQIDDIFICTYNKHINYASAPKKLAQNVSKHGVWFDTAEDFDGENSIIRVDDRSGYPEARLVAVGPIGTRLYVMVFCLCETNVRIISLRKANRREVTEYEKA